MGEYVWNFFPKSNNQICVKDQPKVYKISCGLFSEGYPYPIGSMYGIFSINTYNLLQHNFNQNVSKYTSVIYFHCNQGVCFHTICNIFVRKTSPWEKSHSPLTVGGIPGWWNAGGNVCHRKKKQRSRCFFSEGWNQTVWKRDTHKKQCLKDEGPCGMMLRYPPLKERSISKSL